MIVLMQYSSNFILVVRYNFKVGISRHVTVCAMDGAVRVNFHW